MVLFIVFTYTSSYHWYDDCRKQNTTRNWKMSYQQQQDPLQAVDYSEWFSEQLTDLTVLFLAKQNADTRQLYAGWDKTDLNKKVTLRICHKNHHTHTDRQTAQVCIFCLQVQRYTKIPKTFRKCRRVIADYITNWKFFSCSIKRAGNSFTSHLTKYMVISEHLSKQLIALYRQPNNN